MWTKPTSKQTGTLAEQVAAVYLVSNGLLERCRNFTCKMGEIDLIMADHEQIIFVEVKYRKCNNFGGALAAVNKQKQIKLQKTAHYYLQKQRLNVYNTSCRFDVVAIENDLHHPEITWLKNAF